MADERTPFHNPFAALSHLRGAVPEQAPAPASVADTPAPGRDKSIARAVVRIERAGRGGKEVTVVEQLGLGASELQQWLRQLKAALGCGGSIEDTAIVLQGDHRERLIALLPARGVKRVVRG
jgi:translation initiation factor 1